MIRSGHRFTLCSAALLLAIAGLRAQVPLQPKEGQEDYLGGVGDVLDGKEKTKFGGLRSGTTPIRDEPALLIKGAKWYIYRLTNDKHHVKEEGGDKDKGGTPIETMNDLVKVAHDQLLLPTIRKSGGKLNDNQKEYLKEFSSEVVKCLREVFKRNAKPLVRVNAARILAGVAETGQVGGKDGTADTLVELINNPRESDAVKLYALKGLKELFAWSKPDESVFKDDAKREARCIAAATDYIARQPDLPTAPEEIEALRYVRREAVRALAKSRYAVVPGTTDAKGRTAWWLLKVARKDGLSPDPSLSEQVEAAIGVCNLINKPGKEKDKEVQFDYVAYHVGGAAVDFLTAYVNRVKGGTADPGLAWKHAAARLIEALDNLEAQAKDTSSAAYVQKLVETAKEPLRLVMDGKETNPERLDKWLRDTKNAPKSTTVYKGIADSVIKPAEANP